MKAGGSSPEELETLLEDAFVLRHAGDLRSLFEAGGVLVDESGLEARGAAAIARLAAELFRRDHVSLAEPRRVLQARGTALLVGASGIHVVRRGGDGIWRFAIALLRETTTPREQEER